MNVLRALSNVDDSAFFAKLVNDKKVQAANKFREKIPSYLFYRTLNTLLECKDSRVITEIKLIIIITSDCRKNLIDNKEPKCQR